MELGRRLIVLIGIVELGWLSGCSGPTSPGNTVTASSFVGFWQNIDPNTGDNPQLQIRVDGSTIYVHGYGACVPTFCDWGEASAPAVNAASGTFKVNWSAFGISDQLTLTLGNDGILRTTLAVHYTDDSGRPDRSDAEDFKKAS